jgi:HD-GYP domain-containing protein (c-di-GMP phosphodiesterase class II)
MTSHRPYRERLSTNEAVMRLRFAAGTQLDPDVVSALRDVLGVRAERSLREAS